MSQPVKHSDLMLYLSKLGWKRVESNRAGLDVFIEPQNETPLEILLPNNINSPGYVQHLKDAIRILALIEEREENQVVQSIRSIDKDLHKYRIKTDSSEFVSMQLLHKLLSSAKALLNGASRIEHKKTYDQMPPREKKKAKTPKEQSSLFVQDCNFAHTWRGSFGITIEIPLWLPSIGFLDDIPETLGRKASKRIIKGFSIISVALEKKSFNYILDNIENEDEFLIFDQFPALKESLKKREIEVNIALSPTIKPDKDLTRISSSILNQRSLSYIEKAIEQIKVPSSELEIETIGFPETISASREDLLEDLLDADRRVTVKGVSRELDYAALRMELTLEDYKKAIRAQDEVKNVKVKCIVKKKLKGWEVTKVLSFDLLE